MSANQAVIITLASIYILWNVIRPPAGTTVVQAALREISAFCAIGAVITFSRGVTYLLQLPDVAWFFLEMTCMVTTMMFWIYRVEPWLGWPRVLHDAPEPKEEAGDCSVS